MPDTESSNLQEQFASPVMPHRTETEQAVLGILLMQPSRLTEALNIIKPEAFFLPQHQELFRLLVGMYAGEQVERVDILVVLNEALRRQIFETEAEGKRYLMMLAEQVQIVDNFSAYCETLAEQYNMRRLAEAANEILREIAEGTQSSQVLLDSAEQRIYDIRQGRDVSGLEAIGEVVTRTYQEIGQLAGPDRDEMLGAKTNFADLDRLMNGGLNKSDLVILAARPGVGKTSFALNIATNVARYSGRTVVMYSLEMTKEQLVSRILSTQALVPLSKLRTGQLTPQDWDKLAESADVVSRLNIYLSESSDISVAQMKAQLRRLKDPPGLVVIDYLQLMSSPDRSENRVLEISSITRNLKLMAKELCVPVLLLSQLNRALESRTDKRPHVADLRESGSIEQDADIIMFLYQDAMYHPGKTSPNEVECIVEKNRHGEKGTIKLNWDGQFTRFSTLDNHSIPPN